MDKDPFFSLLAKNNSVDAVERAFFEFVDRRDFTREIQQSVDSENYDLIGKVTNSGIVLYEDDQWRMILTLDGFATEPEVAITFASQSLYSVVSNQPFLLYAYPETDEGIRVTGEKQLQETRQFKILANGYAYEFCDKEEKVFVALHNKSIERAVCARYNSKTGEKTGIYSGTYNLDRYKVFIDIINQFGAPGIPFLEELTKHPVNAIRWQALVKMFKLDHARAKHILELFLQDPCKTIRAQTNATKAQLAEFEKRTA